MSALSKLMRRARLPFPLSRPNWPIDVPKPAPKSKVGANFDTAWGRRREVRAVRALITDYLTRPEFDPVFHPSYIDFWENVLTETRDPKEIEARFERDFAEDPWYIHLYRTGHAYHGVHPFYMWYWGAHALDHLGAVIILGGDAKSARRLGFMAASTMNDALEMASQYVGVNPTITHLHSPPLVMAEVL